MGRYFDLSVASMKDASANLWMDGFFSVSRVELVSVTLADGSTHNYSGCRVDISPKMLVGAR